MSWLTGSDPWEMKMRGSQPAGFSRKNKAECQDSRGDPWGSKTHGFQPVCKPKKTAKHLFFRDLIGMAVSRLKLMFYGSYGDSIKASINRTIFYQ